MPSFQNAICMAIGTWQICEVRAGLGQVGLKADTSSPTRLGDEGGGGGGF